MSLPTQSVIFTKWNHAKDHLIPSIGGYSRMLVKTPFFAIQLAWVRLKYFISGHMEKSLPTPDRFLLENHAELLSYWGFFVEGELISPHWVGALRLETRPVIVDVGANAGLFSHFIWTYNSNCQFILFEPLPMLADKISRWGKATGANIKLHNLAVSDHCGTATFYYNSENLDTTASLDPDGGRKLKCEIKTVTLDSVISDPSILLLKIDVEGFEAEVLKGAVETLRRTRFIILESHTQKLLQEIKAILGNEWHGSKIGVSDYFFMRQTDPLHAHSKPPMAGKTGLVET